MPLEVIRQELPFGLVRDQVNYSYSVLSGDLLGIARMLREE